MDSESEKLDALSERIRKAEAKPAVAMKPRPAAHNAGYDFIGIVIGAGMLGALADYGLGTMPWCLLGMILFGFVAGMIGAWRAMQKPDNEET